MHLELRYPHLVAPRPERLDHHRESRRIEGGLERRQPANRWDEDQQRHLATEGRDLDDIQQVIVGAVIPVSVRGAKRALGHRGSDDQER